MKLIGKKLTRNEQANILGGQAIAGDCTLSCKDKDNNVLGTTITTSCTTGDNNQKCKDAGYDKTDSSSCFCGGVD